MVIQLAALLPAIIGGAKALGTAAAAGGAKALGTAAMGAKALGSAAAGMGGAAKAAGSSIGSSMMPSMGAAYVPSAANYVPQHLAGQGLAGFANKLGPMLAQNNNGNITMGPLGMMLSNTGAALGGPGSTADRLNQSNMDYSGRGAMANQIQMLTKAMGGGMGGGQSTMGGGTGNLGSAIQTAGANPANAQPSALAQAPIQAQPIGAAPMIPSPVPDQRGSPSNFPHPLLSPVTSRWLQQGGIRGANFLDTSTSF